ncbi:PhzF family phenazine biosynthesis protein [Lysobacter silvisoli]|uniref:PhzF family phenazine biosynthesis protein n=1 Tax=Lysobacter silvisoli TaxID=2293254 RepID=A0A371K5V3_9GAMM|nr:PhzF family phenazine biosynthesis protein [Lysobacter silvisoli]RDZ29321.1 PhzF family phenazine biosynthesis protein [Lysobacter silvisoli]
MTLRRYLQVDVFADRPGAGNPLGVVLNGDGLDSAAMQAFAAWTNLSETIFLLPPVEGADYRVRIFTPRQELAFAGHPSVGAAWAAIDAGLAKPRDGALVQDCAAGLLPVRVAGEGARATVSVRAPRSTRIDTAAREDAAAIDALLAAVTAPLRLSERPPALWDNGARWWLLELSDAAQVRALQPDLVAIAALTRACGAVGLAVYAYADATDHQLAVRAFCPADNIPEDPVTGSANASIAAQLAQAGALPSGGSGYVASQGRELGRDGRIEVRVDEDGEVWIGGRVQAVIRGRADW